LPTGFISMFYCNKTVTILQYSTNNAIWDITRV
jgi:hypothetical protein